MSHSPDTPTNLEHLVGRALRDLPLRAAPQTLQHRVLAAIAERATVPWWHQAFRHWPVVAQCAFLVSSLAFVKIALSMWELGSSALPDVATVDMETGLSWMRSAGTLAISLDETARVLSTSLPQAWLYGGVVLILGLYVLLFGIGAAGFRAFKVPR